ncbi:hypothetical protein DPQ33_17795 [Oceanidesulfovibrio indonesiensis]|uniref:Uncharacterized protein n=1 Tax=Oceanidesulfovibrio indonesiensis TaxID=54767 RepID=A0A7M3MA22_9BACT|nr:hypothetical protein [Oceanidesulfovibrio indonesiensis]TVM14166.1 hypothetical protein DPQ33_17795 [Oceanidesulfovibrio indonesiensis]
MMSRLLVLLFFGIGFVFFAMVKSAGKGFRAAKDVVFEDAGVPKRIQSNDDLFFIIAHYGLNRYVHKRKTCSVLQSLTSAMEKTLLELNQRGFDCNHKDLAEMVFSIVKAECLEDGYVLNRFKERFLSQYN